MMCEANCKPGECAKFGELETPVWCLVHGKVIPASSAARFEAMATRRPGMSLQAVWEEYQAVNKTGAAERYFGCPHRGGVTGSLAACGLCTKYKCAIHGECALAPNTQVQDCVSCADRPLAVHVSAQGIGDAVCGMYAACGLADATSRPVALYVRCRDWLEPLRHPGVTVLPYDAKGANANADYPGQVASRPTRKQDYCANMAQWHRLASFMPVAPEPRQYTANGQFVLAPWAHWQNRSWPLTHWVELAGRLLHAGRAVTVIDGPGDGARIRDAFGGLPLGWRWGMPPAECCELLGGAQCVVANDSGIAHVAGALRAPTVCVHAGSLPTGFLFDCAGTVREVVSGLALPRSDNNAPALAQVPVQAVCDAIWRAPAQGRTLLSDDKLDGLLAALSAAPDGLVAELGVHRGGCAAMLAAAAPHRTVHAYDTFSGMPGPCAPGEHGEGEFADCGDALHHLGRYRNVEVKRGVFPSTAEGGGFAMVHLDADTYESTRAGMEWFWPRMEPGGKMVFDDYLWESCPGVARAIAEAGLEGEQTALYQYTVTK